MNDKTIQQDIKRFCYVYGIDLSGNSRNGIAIAHEGYATAFEHWATVLYALQEWRSGISFRDACVKAGKRD